MEKEKLKIAIVHDWLVTYRGGEKVLEAICELYPNAPIYTLFFSKNHIPENLKKRTIIYPKTLNKLRYFRKILLPFLPDAIESFELTQFDLIISSSSCVAKGIIPSPTAKHICYIHSPMRYLWDQRSHYFSLLKKIPFVCLLLNKLLKNLRLWDSTSNNRVDLFISNSYFVRQRVERYYRRGSSVLHPPIDLKKINHSLQKLKNSEPKNYYLILGAFVPYKRFDLAIKAFNETKETLYIIGNGPGYKSLKKISGNNIFFKRNASDLEVLTLLSGAKALIFPGTEDFGMTAIEALACGTPIIAHRSGGALDFIEENTNGIYFNEQKTSSLKKALSKFQSQKFDKNKIKETARKFSLEKFQSSFKQTVEKTLKKDSSFV